MPEALPAPTTEDIPPGEPASDLAIQQLIAGVVEEAEENARREREAEQARQRELEELRSENIRYFFDAYFFRAWTFMFRAQYDALVHLNSTESVPLSQVRPFDTRSVQAGTTSDFDTWLRYLVSFRFVEESQTEAEPEPSVKITPAGKGFLKFVAAEGLQPMSLPY